MSDDAYDAVVIGSGLGGLTAAALLAKAGRKVCIIERNRTVGGAASSFNKGRLTIEPALHQTADPHNPGEPKHAILKELGLLDEIEWIPIMPFYSVKGGPIGEAFDLPVGFDAAHLALSKRFPKSSGGFARLLGAMEHMLHGVAELMEAREERSIGKLVHGLMESRGLIHDWRASTGAVLQRELGDDEGAKFAVAANLAYYADDPRHLAWPFFALAQGGYLKTGGRFIKGGSRVLSMKLAKSVMKQGGSVMLGREAKGIDFDGSGHPAFVRHVDPKTNEDEQRVPATQVFANCAPHVLARMLPDAERAKIEHAYLGQPLSTSLFSAHFGLSVPPAKLGLDQYGLIVLPDWMNSLSQYGESARLFSADPGNRLPSYIMANYGAIDSGLAGDGPVLVSVVGLDRFNNWAALSPQDEKDRRERWLDAFQAALERDYPGFSAAVAERMFLNARSMHNFMNTPGGAIYGFAPIPLEHSILSGVPRSPKTPLTGVFLASSFAGSGGFTGAMMAGADSARMAMKERAH
jgi:phytoene dehydrogenase-like protein